MNECNIERNKALNKQINKSKKFFRQTLALMDHHRPSFKNFAGHSTGTSNFKLEKRLKKFC